MRKYIKFIVLVALAAAILWWFGRTLNWQEVNQSLSRANGLLLFLAVLGISVSYLLRAFRWRALLAPITEASMRELFSATTVGFSAVFFFGRAGEIVRPVVLPMREHRVHPSASLVTIMVERLFDFSAVILLFAFNLLWFQAPASHASEFAVVRMAGVALVAGLIIGIAALVWFKHRAARVIAMVERILGRFRFVPERLSRAVVSMLDHLATALSVLVDARELFVTVGWTVALWSSIVVANWLILLAFGLPFGIAATVFVLGWAMVGSLVPTPGGAAGAFHYATATGLVFLGRDRDEAAAVAIITHLIDFAPAVIFGLYFVLRGDINLSRLKELVSSKKATEIDVHNISELTDDSTRGDDTGIAVEGSPG